MNRPCGLIQTCIPSQLNRSGRDASVNNCQIRRLHTRGQCFYLHVIQIQICIIITAVTDSLEENRYGIIGIVTEVDLHQLPFRNTGHTAVLQRDTLTVFSGDEDLSCTTGRVLPLEGQQSRLTQYNLRSSKDAIQTAGRIIRVHAKTCTFITGSIVVPTIRSGCHRSLCVVPTLRNTALQIIEVLNERHSERISIRLEGSTDTCAEAFATLLAQIEDVIRLLGQISDYQRVLSYRCHCFSGRLSLRSRQTCIYPGVAVIIIRPGSRGRLRTDFRDLQTARFDTIRSYVDLHIIQIQICIAVSIVTCSLEIERYNLTHISRQVDLEVRPIRYTGQTAGQQGRLRYTVIGRDQHFTCTTGWVLPVERKDSSYRKVNTRSSQEVGIPVRVAVRIETQTRIANSYQIFAPSKRSRSGCTF